MNLTIEDLCFDDSAVIGEMMQLSLAEYERLANDETVEVRTRMQFVRQHQHGNELLSQLRAQSHKHKVAFIAADGEGTRWHLMNMLSTGAELYIKGADALPSGVLKTQMLAKATRAEELRELVETVAIVSDK